MFRSASATPLSFEGGYPSIGSKLGMSQAKLQNPLFLDYYGTFGRGGAPFARAGGHYRMQPGRPDLCAGRGARAGVRSSGASGPYRIAEH